jgi:Tfp pilus assembly protein PilF
MQFLGRTHEAEADLREAVKLDNLISSAHYHLGNLLQARGELEAAGREQTEAIHLDDKYAEPHAALAHIYNQMGKKSAADEEVKAYQSLRASKSDRQ